MFHHGNIYQRDHRFWYVAGQGAKTGSKAACHYDRFHRSVALICEKSYLIKSIEKMRCTQQKINRFNV
jgi:hypothetical protein